MELATVREAQRAIDVLYDTELDGRKILIREDREDGVIQPSSMRGRFGKMGGGKEVETSKRKAGEQA